MNTLFAVEPHVITDNLDELLDILPAELRAAIAPSQRPHLLEIVLDLGRKPEARFAQSAQYLREGVVTREELDKIEAQLGSFGDDNRAGLPATLHRISAMRNRRGTIVGLTLRVGRAVTGIVDILRDLIESGQSVLLMGRPGLGKTTLLREIARVLADEANKRVVVVDTSNEIAGDGDVPHPAIGRARRMQVKHVALQHDVMIEAVENHMPEVIVIDEIGRTEESLAARTIAERGVQLIATVHGNTLDNLIANPSMSDLIGGIQSVTLGDEEARRRRTQKTVLERKNPPTFDVVIEMIERDRIAVRRPVADVVDTILRGREAPPEIRWRGEDGEIQIMQPAPVQEPEPDPEPPRGHNNRGGRGVNRYGRERSGGGGGDNRNQSNRAMGQSGPSRGSSNSGNGSVYFSMSAPLPRSVAQRSEVDDDEDSINSFNKAEPFEDELGEELEPVIPSFQTGPVDVTRIRKIYPFGISKSRLARAAKHLGLQLTPARTWQEADAILMLSGAEGFPETTSLLREAREHHLPIIGVGGNTYAQITARLNDLYSQPGIDGKSSPRDIAVQEAKDAAVRVMGEAQPVELRPQIKSLRRLQHQIAERYHLRSFSVGREPNRRVKLVPAPGR
ncbi:AAA family ATPase [bacterium]|nr:MAG: AAA family ATPase [bacterium]